MTWITEARARLADRDKPLASDEGIASAQAEWEGDLYAIAERGLDALDAVLAEHERRWNHATQQYECSTCMEDHFAGDVVYMAPWPCPTVRAIEGTD